MITAPCEWSCRICGSPIDGDSSTLVRARFVGVLLMTCRSRYCVDRALRGDLKPIHERPTHCALGEAEALTEGYLPNLASIS